MTDTDTELHLPFLRVGDYGWKIMRLPADEYDKARNALVDKVYAAHNVEPAPPVWAEEPLRRWCWLILVVNDLERDPEVHHPLTHWDIDLGFSSTELREWIWAIS